MPIWVPAPKVLGSPVPGSQVLRCIEYSVLQSVGYVFCEHLVYTVVFDGSDKYYSKAMYPLLIVTAVISHLHHLGWAHLSSFDVQWYSGAGGGVREG